MKRQLDKPIKVVRKREEEILPVLNALRMKYPRLYDHDLLSYMYLMMKDQVKHFKEGSKKDRKAIDLAYAFDRGRQKQ